MSRGNASGTIFTFILGVSVGAVTALLLAPKAGEELRGDIATGVSNGVSQVRSTGKDLNRRAQKIVALAQDHVQGAVEAGQEASEESMSLTKPPVESAIANDWKIRGSPGILWN